MSLNFFPLNTHTSSHLFYKQTSSSDLCSDSFCPYNIYVKFLFSRIGQLLGFNEVCAEEDVALFSKRNRKSAAALQVFNSRTVKRISSKMCFWVRNLQGRENLVVLG